MSEKQKTAQKATAQQSGCSYPGFDSALKIPSADAAQFSKSSSHIYGEDIQASSPEKGKRNRHLQFTVRRTDITDVEKVSLCNALLARGGLAEAIFHRGQRRIDTDYELDLMLTCIVPWEYCKDPNNYILLDLQFADHFELGLISFHKNSNQIQDPAMGEDAFDPRDDRYFSLSRNSIKNRRNTCTCIAHIFSNIGALASASIYTSWVNNID